MWTKTHVIISIVLTTLLLTPSAVQAEDLFPCNNISVNISDPPGSVTVTLNNWDSSKYPSHYLHVYFPDQPGIQPKIVSGPECLNGVHSTTVTRTFSWDSEVNNKTISIALRNAPNPAACNFPILSDAAQFFNPIVCRLTFIPDQRAGETIDRMVAVFDACNNIPPDQTKQKEDCTACANNAGIYTALGCLRYDPQNLAQDIIALALSIAGGIALLLMLYGAFLVAISSGDPKQAEQGKGIFTSSIIGLLFIIFSVVLLKIIGIDILRLPGL